MPMELLLLLLALLLLVCGVANGYDVGDRVSLATRSSHADRDAVWRTSWVDLPLFLCPRFAEPEETIFHAVVLKTRGNSHLSNNSEPELVVQADTLTGFRANPAVDFRFTLAFDNHRLALPWITIFDAAQRRTLVKLVITLTHNAYEVINVSFETTYGPKLERVDPTHPALRGFRLQYKWINGQAEDFELAKRVLLGVTVGAFLLILVLLFYSNNHEDSSSGAGYAMQGQNGSEKSAKGGFRPSRPAQK